ncbi:neuropeptide-like precursor 1 isoform X2 [Xylocopa sonorina]|uniref:neuropeptide-like precursor 1 isoform X2 n=1 Tax=Xylocopa sonorina TaxID=1818115 RepID=UPI00403B21C0
MGLTRNDLVSLLLLITVVNEIRLPLVTCQDEDSTQCLPKPVFLALLRYPEVSSNLAAYSRSARVTQDVKSRNDMAHLRALTGETDDTEICVPGRVYSQLLKDPVVRSDLSIILNGRVQKLPEFFGRMLDEGGDTNAREFRESQKRSLATLAKNDDLPISIQERMMENEDDEEKRAVVSSDQSSRSGQEQDFLMEKRNVGTLARDFALPPGRRNIASLVRDYDQNRSNKERVLHGKRNVAALARTYALPQSGKRNVASVAREYGLPYGKRYVGALARADDFPNRQQRSVASLAKNSAWPMSLKRGSTMPGTIILRTLSRQGRSLADELKARSDLLDLQELGNLEQNQEDDDYEADEEKLNEPWSEIETNIRRFKRQIGFSDEYPLPVIQNANVLDYDEIIEALSGRYPSTEKRFMGSAPETQPEVGQYGYPETFRASKRHIGALARLGWLPSLRVARFSRSPRYLDGRKNSANGPSTDYSTSSSTRSLRPDYNPRTSYVQALHGDCRHGFKRFLLLPTTDNYFHQKLPSSLLSNSL